MRFHALGIPHTITRQDYSACAFTQKVLKWCKMMMARGHTVYHYGHEDSVVECTEHVTVTTNDDLKMAYGNYDWKKEFFKHNMSDHAHQTFYANAIREIGLRKQPHDFILCFWGRGHTPVSNEHPDCIAVEPGIGYLHEFSTNFAVFESYSIMNQTYGLCKAQPRWYDAVIPNYFDAADFQVNLNQDNEYFAFVGRLIPDKGVAIAVEITARLGVKLKIAGQGDLKSLLGVDELPPHVEHVGYVEPKARSELMGNAKALFAPTHFNEPFGGVVVEAMMCGTPVITSDWGAFAETVLHGTTGYRCRTMEHFLYAAKNIEKIDRHAVCKWAHSNYSLERVALMYEEYFRMILDVYQGAGFYEYRYATEREDMDWLVKNHV
jgi:glycosyltransferase involved in cell wall biosynthesis